MKNMAEIFLMRAGFSNKLILYTLRRIVRAELSRRIVLHRIVRTPIMMMMAGSLAFTPPRWRDE